MRIFQRIILSGVLISWSIHAFATTPSCTAMLRSISFSGLALVEVLRSARKTKVYVPLEAGDLAAELLLMGDVYDPTAYEGGHNLLQTAFPEMERDKTVLVMGTGSGYEAVALALRFPALKVDAVDISARAVMNTELNIEFHHLSGRVRVWQSDLFKSVPERYDHIIFHAPRPIESSYEKVNRKIGDNKFFDLGGQIRERFISEAPAHLNSGGSLFLLTESDFRPKPLKVAPWSVLAPEEGDYGIFKIVSP